MKKGGTHTEFTWNVVKRCIDHGLWFARWALRSTWEESLLQPPRPVKRMSVRHYSIGLSTSGRFAIRCKISWFVDLSCWYMELRFTSELWPLIGMSIHLLTGHLGQKPGIWGQSLTESSKAIKQSKRGRTRCDVQTNYLQEILWIRLWICWSVSTLSHTAPYGPWILT